MTREDEKFLNDWLTKIVDAKIPQIILEVKYIPVKIEEPKPKYDDAVWKSKTRVTSYELRVQMHELRVQIQELRVQIHELRVQIHELRVQIHELED